MVNKRGYSYGAEFPFHYEQLIDGWSVFDARTDEVHGSGLAEWEAQALCQKLNGSPPPNLADIDATP